MLQAIAPGDTAALEALLPDEWVAVGGIQSPADFRGIPSGIPGMGENVVRARIRSERQ